MTAGVANSPEIILNIDDQYGNVVTSNNSDVTLTVHSGPGSLSGTDTVAFSSGVAQLDNVIIDTAGAYTLTATSGLISANSGSFTVSAASASQVVFSQQPTDVVINSAISPSITVDVEDQFGNVVTGDTSNVTLAINTGSGSIGGTDTVAASSGVATFDNVTINALGAHTLHASDGSLTIANSSSFTVNPAPASQIVFDQQPTTVTAGNAISPAITADLEDQFGDIVTTDTSTVTLTVASGPGSIGGTDSVAAVSGVATFSNVIFDTASSYTISAANGVASAATSNSFTVNPGSSDKVEFVQNPTTATAGVTISPAVTVAVEDQFGNVVTGDTSNVMLSVNSGTGSLSGTLTEAASSGIATFSNLSMTAAGAKTLLAIDGSLAAADSGSFTIDATTATKYVFAQGPSDSSAGSAISPAVVVDIEDQYGNVVTTYTQNVTLSVNSGPGVFSGTSSVNAVAGVATFSDLILDTAGAYTIDAANGILSFALSGSFNVSAAAASKLAFSTQPGTSTAGADISPSPVVDVEDQFGNIITSDSSNVTLSVASGGGSVTGTPTVAASSGVATFSGAVIDTAGTHTIAASDGSLTSATSSSFTIHPAGASQMVFTQQPTTVAAGVAISPAITVAIEDPFGNLTNSSPSVSLSIDTGPGSIGGTDSVFASGGIATFNNVLFDTAGNYTLTVAAGGLPDANSASFTVNPGAESLIVWGQQPSDVAAGAAISPSMTVEAEDSFGNIVTSDSRSVTLAVATGPGSIGGTDTVAFSSGVATFSNVKFDMAGSYSIAASDSFSPVTTSNSFTVSPAAASQVAFVQQPSTVTAGSAISPAITVDVEDPFGNIVTTDSSNVTLAIHTGGGSIGGTSTVAASSGVATFSDVLIDTSGAHTLGASDGVLTGAVSSAFTVNPAAASQLAFAQQPSTVAAGSAISPSIVVDVEDQYGNIVTSNSSNVTLSINTGPGAIGGTDTVAASSGVATFSNVKLNTAGAYTLAASDGSLTGADSSSFTVNPAAASQLVVNQQPSDVTAGSAISPSMTVDVEDQFGNILTGNTSNVTLAVHSGAGSIGGTDTVAASAGVATFANVIFDTAGTYTLTASDGALTSATTGSFTVSPAAASQVAFSQQPTRTLVATAITPAMTVNVEDRFGNIVTSDTSTITLSVHTGPGDLTGTVSAAAVGGVATFDNVVIDITGTYTLTASDGSLTSANSSSFVVGSSGVATQIVFLQTPSAEWQFGPVNVQVAVEDAFGNIVTDSSAPITISTNETGSLGGTMTVDADNGVATFSNIYLAKSGTFSFSASGGGFSAGNGFSVQSVALPVVVRTRALINPAPFDPTYVLGLERYFGAK